MVEDYQLRVDPRTAADDRRIAGALSAQRMFFRQNDSDALQMLTARIFKTVQPSSITPFKP